MAVKQWQVWNAHGACASCGGKMPADPKHLDMRCPTCVQQNKPLQVKPIRRIANNHP